jgi:hypothetical protein
MRLLAAAGPVRRTLRLLETRLSELAATPAHRSARPPPLLGQAWAPPRARQQRPPPGGRPGLRPGGLPVAGKPMLHH